MKNPKVRTDAELVAQIHALFRAAETAGLWAHWAVTGIYADDLSKPHPYCAKTLIYDTWRWSADNQQVDVHIEAPISGSSWLDLWRVADQAMRDSGDIGHRFIENFRRERGRLRLYVGS